MSKLIAQELITEKGRIVEAPHIPTTVDRSFQVPTKLYGTTVGCYLGFLAVMAMGFGTPGLIIPMVIFAFFIVAAFGVPAIWTKLAGIRSGRPMSDGEFAQKGIQTNTGPLKARDAAAQMLILPVLILLWGFAVVTIAAIT